RPSGIGNEEVEPILREINEYNGEEASSSSQANKAVYEFSDLNVLRKKKHSSNFSARFYEPKVKPNKLSDMMTNKKILKAGGLLPLQDYFINILNDFEIAPMQLPPNAWKILSCLRIVYYFMDFEGPTHYMYAPKLCPQLVGYLHLVAWRSDSEYELMGNVGSNAGKWKDRYFFLDYLPVKLEEMAQKLLRLFELMSRS
ncbi:hypothetical protein PanWU01x14_308350, partial [Parasponia andersonii]